MNRKKLVKAVVTGTGFSLLVSCTLFFAYLLTLELRVAELNKRKSVLEVTYFILEDHSFNSCPNTLNQRIKSDLDKEIVILETNVDENTKVSFIYQENLGIQCLYEAISECEIIQYDEIHGQVSFEFFYNERFYRVDSDSKFNTKVISIEDFINNFKINEECN